MMSKKEEGYLTWVFESKTEKFSSGLYRGKTLWQVFETDFSYIEWLALNIEYFVISDDLLEEMNKTGRIIPIVIEALYRNGRKYDDYCEDDIGIEQDNSWFTSFNNSGGEWSDS